jgi:hypothetical protein
MHTRIGLVGWIARLLSIAIVVSGFTSWLLPQERIIIIPSIIALIILFTIGKWKNWKLRILSSFVNRRESRRAITEDLHNVERLWKDRDLKYTPLSNKLDSSTFIRKALENVDSLHRHFRDEQEANKELYSSLKSLVPDADIEYEPRYRGKNVGDIRFRNIIIEGKLDLHTKSETDRLIGQIQYCTSNTPFAVRVVIYGTSSPIAYERLKSCISEYSGLVKVIELDNPQRRRRDSF